MMWMWIAYGLLILSIISFFIGFKGKYYYYWVSAFTMYLFSFLGGFSIGQFTVGFVFFPLTLAIAHLVGCIQHRQSRILFLLIGFIIGLFVVIFARAIVLYPLVWLLSPLLSS